MMDFDWLSNIYHGHTNRVVRRGGCGLWNGIYSIAHQNQSYNCDLYHDPSVKDDIYLGDLCELKHY